MSVAAIMLFLINKIFNDTRRVVSRGVETSEVTGGYRAFAEQLERDTHIPPDKFQMLGPGNGDSAAGGSHNVGLLTILIKEVNNVRMPDPSGGTGFVQETLRTDQLMFFRKAMTLSASLKYPTGSSPQVDGTEVLEQTTALNAGTYSADAQAKSRYARVWYGHLDLTNEDGTRNTAETLVDATGAYTNGWDWVLGRQAMLLVGPEVPIVNSSPPPDSTWRTVGSPGAYFNRVDGVTWDSTIQTISHGLTYDQLFMGVSDVSEFGLHSSEVWVDPAQPGEAIIGLNGDTNFTNYPLSTNQTHTDYRDFVYEMTYGPERLRGNPSPPWPIEAWQYSQSHPVLLPNVSDFQVHFAADANNDGEIDRDDDANGLDGRPDDVTYNANDPIVWYGSYDTSGAIILPDAAPFNYTVGWSGGTTPAETYDPLQDARPGIINTNSDIALVWRHDDGRITSPFVAGDPTNSKWPHLIRIRFRAHDSQGELTSTVYGGRDGKDNDDDGSVDIDNDADENADFATSGKWFEVIFRVPRPQ